MKNFEGLNYYEILKIPANSVSFEIKRAYQDTLSMYNEDSLVTYSLFSNEERDNILKTVKEAFSTLIDENKRAAYDTILLDSGQIEVSITSIQNRRKPPHAHTCNMTDSDNFDERVRKKSRKKEIETLSNEVLSKDLISGDDLKKMRKAAGIELSEINAVTKISVSVLKSMEENRIQSLPPNIYLKNFLRQYAEILQIDPQKVIDGYLKNISPAQKK
ncbi:MAG: helix-turn-helix domain-containing protein [Thermodesulfobacteriota bacterium]|nr:helix-turn-helix domain-containing protein [Thermodesulfobacteriota bacterium]